jgi:hypothetical protein
MFDQLETLKGLIGLELNKVLDEFFFDDEETKEDAYKNYQNIITDGMVMIQAENILGFNEVYGNNKFKRPEQLFVIKWSELAVGITTHVNNGYLKVMTCNDKLWIEDWTEDDNEEEEYFMFNHSTLSNADRINIYCGEPLNRCRNLQYFYDKEYEGNYVN